MHTVIGTGSKPCLPQAPGARVMLLTDRPDGPTAQRLAGYGSLVEIEDRFDAALGWVLDDPMGYDLFVMDCDAFGGIAGAERAVVTLVAAEARMRCILVSAEFDEPAFPLGRRTAVCLPTAAEDDDFRRGFDHALRDRVAMTMM